MSRQSHSQPHQASPTDRPQIPRLPTLAGLASLQRAIQAGKWSVNESVQRWKRIHFCLRRALQSMVARIPSEPLYELKLIYSHHAYILSEQISLIRRRVGEMREPPLGLNKVPHAGLKRFFDNLHSCADTLPFTIALYELLLPEVVVACQKIQQQAHPVADAPSVRAAKLISFELDEIIQVGQQVSSSLLDWEAKAVEGSVAATSHDISCWLDRLRACLHEADGLDGSTSNQINTLELTPVEFETPAQKSVTARLVSSCPDSIQGSTNSPWPNRFDYSSTPRRDIRFQDSYNAGVNAEAFLYDQRFSAQDKTLMMYYKRLREIDVPETMASILTEIEGKPWEFHAEMLRQLWDEARHAMLGEIGFSSLGIDWTQIPINFTWSLNLNTQLTPQERHGVLFFIEQGLMTRTGKRYEWEIALQSHDPLAALFQDFDWADEVLHAQIGRRWYVKQFASLKEALAYGDQCWNRVMSHWQEYLDRGLTEHRNWWPDLYLQACHRWQKSADPQALQFCTSYANRRADLREITPD